MNILDAAKIRHGGASGAGRPMSMPSPVSPPSIAAINQLVAPEQAPTVSPAEKRGPVREFIHDVGQAARAVGTGLYSAVADRLPEGVAKAAMGGDVTLDGSGRLQKYVEQQKQDARRFEMSPEDRENKLFGIVKAGTVQSGLQNLGDSIAPMAAGIASGAATGSAGAGPIGTAVGAAVGAGALTGPMMYRSSKTDYVLQMRDAFKQAMPSGTEEQWQAFRKEIEGNARLYALWEAGPEVVGNMVTAGLIKTPVGSMVSAIPLIENSAARLLAAGVAKMAVDMPVEVATETVTQYNQAKIEYESGLRAEPPTPAGAFIEAAPQTVVLTLATMGFGSVANQLFSDTRGQVQRHKIIRLLNKSGVSKETIGDLLDANNWKEFDASIQKHKADIEKVGVDLAQAEQQAGRPVDHNAPPVNPLITPPPAAEPQSVFDQPMAPATPEATGPAVNPLMDAPKPTANAEDAKLVSDAMASRGEKFSAIQAVDAPQSNPAVRAVAEASEKFGLRTIWVSGPRVDGMVVQGAVVGDKPVLLLNTELLTDPRRDPVMMVYAHELTHRSQKVDPKHYATLEAAVLARADAAANVQQKIAAGMDEATARSEAVAEAVEVLGTDQTFWQEVFTGKEQSFIDHILQILGEMAERVFGTNQAQKADAIRGAAVAAFQALQKQGTQATTDATVATSPIIQQQQQPTATEAENGVQKGQAEALKRDAEPSPREDTSRLDNSKHPTVELPIESLKLSKDVPNFKEGAGETGEVEPLQGKYERLGTPPIVVWERTNGDMEIITGRHRWNLARRSGEKTIPAQIVREADGFTREAAAIFDAEANIRDGQGSVKDYANYFRNSKISREEASGRGLLSRDKGRSGFDIGTGASDDLYALYAAEKITSAKAAAIARSAPNSAEAQNLGIKYAETHTADQTAQYMKAVVSMAPKSSGKQLNLLGWDESWQIEADKMGVAAAAIVKDKTGERTALKHASSLTGKKQADIVKQYGFQPGDADKIRERIGELESEIARWDEWNLDSELTAIVREKAGLAPAESAQADDQLNQASPQDDTGSMFSMKPDRPLAETASAIQDKAERDAYARSEIEKLARIPKAQGNNILALGQNRVTGEARRALAKLEAGEIRAVDALKAVDEAMAQAEKAIAADEKSSKQAREAAVESRQQTLPLTPFGTPEPAGQGVLFSAKKATNEDVENADRGTSFSMKFDGDSRQREYGWNKFAWRQLGVMRNQTYGQKSTEEAIAEIESIMDKRGYQWMLDHLTDLSKETKDEFPVRLRGLAGSMIHDTAQRIFRQYGIADDGSNMPSDPAIEKLWLDISNSEKLAKEQEVEFGRSASYERARYSAGNMTNPFGVRKTLNDIADKAASAEITKAAGPEAAKASQTVNADLKKAYDEAVAALESERQKNAASAETIATLHNSLKKRNRMQISENEKARASNKDAATKVNEYLDELAASIEAAGGSVAGLSAKPTMDLLKMYATYYVGKKGREADTAGVRAFVEKHGFTGLDDVTIDALINDANIAIGSRIRAPAASKKTGAKPKKPLNLDGQPVVIVGEADAKRIALEATEAGQTVMRNISNNLEVIVSNAVRHGRNKAGIAAKLVEAGVDTATANRIARDVVKARQDAMRPAIETLRQRYAKRGDKIGKTVVSAMDRIMRAMELADAAAEPKVSGFFDGNAWDESRHIIEEAFGFKSEITREWFGETMKLYREYEKADEAGDHIKSSDLHSKMLDRIAYAQNSKDWRIALRAYVQGGMLAGPSTHEWNFSSTGARAFGFANVQAARQIVRLLKTGDPKYLAAAYLPFEILLRSHKQGAALFRHILKTGVNPLSMRTGDEGKFSSDPNVVNAAEYHPFFKWKINRGFKYIGRLLRAADAYFRTGIENSDIVMRSYNELVKSGQSVPQAIKQSLGLVGMVTDGTNETYSKAAAKADALSLKGFERQMNILIDMRNALDPEYREKAEIRGSVETFNDQNAEGIVGMTADMLRNNAAGTGAWWIGMFARVGANLYNHMQHSAPVWSAIMLAKDIKMGRYKGQQYSKLTDSDEIEIRSIRAASSLALGSIAVGLCMKALADAEGEDDDKKKKPKFMLTAAGPTDTNLRKLWSKTEKPYTMTINGREFSYKWMAGLAVSLSMAGAWMDEKRFGSLKDASIDGKNFGMTGEMLVTMSLGMLDSMSMDLPGQGLMDFFDIISTANQPGNAKLRGIEKWAEKNLASIGSGFIPYSRMTIFLDRVASKEQMTARTIDGMKGVLFSTFRDIPGVRNAVLYPLRDIWGNPITYPANAGKDMGIGERAARLAVDRFINNAADDPYTQFLVAAQVPIRAPYQNETSVVVVENGKYGLRNLTSQEYDDFLVIFGSELRTQIGLVYDRYNSTDQFKKQIRPDNESLKKQIKDARSYAMKWAMQKYLIKKGDRLTTTPKED